MIPKDHPHKRLIAVLEKQVTADVTAALEELKRTIFRGIKRSNVEDVFVRLADPDINEKLRTRLYMALLPTVDAGVDVERKRIEKSLLGVKTIGDISFSWDLVNEAARKWLRQHTFSLTYANEFSITRSTAAMLRDVIDSFITLGDMTINQLAEQVNGLFDVIRGEMIAVTEVTRVFARGNQVAWRESGVIKEQRWNTAVDELVCPICAPLNGKVVGINETWDGVIDSPPAHPLCRCFLTPVVRVENNGSEVEQTENDLEKNIEWHASMNREDAEKWARNSVYKDDVFHVTLAKNVNSLMQNGFDLSKLTFGRVWGNGAYVAIDPRTAEFYDILYLRSGTTAETLRLKINIKNPALIDLASGIDIRNTIEYKNLFSQISSDLHRNNNEISKNNPAAIWRMQNPSSINVPADILEQAERYLTENKFIEDVFAEAMTETLRRLGYDSLIVKEASLTQKVGGNQIIVFDPKNLVIIK